MSPEEKDRIEIDSKLEQAGWIIQDLKDMNISASLGVAVREYPTSSGEVDYALFVDEIPVGIVEAKRKEKGEDITVVERQTSRYANSTFKYIKNEYEIRFAYEATSKLIRFTDYHDEKYRSREVFSFHQPKTLKRILEEKDTVRNNLKHLPPLETTGFRKCQIDCINNLTKSFAENRPRALAQMATGAGKTFTAITQSYRLLKYGKMNRILFLVDTKSLGIQAANEFYAYIPNDDSRTFNEIFGVYRLTKSYMPETSHVYISTIQRMYSILTNQELDEKTEEEIDENRDSIIGTKEKEVVYNPKYPPEFFDCIIVDECHRSIYNVWKQVLEYFDSFIIGLTATPDKRTFAFFNQNVVSEYTREQAIVDGVNVGEDIFLIETKITKNGAKIEMNQIVEHRNRQTREKRQEELDEDINYVPAELDKEIVNPSQIRLIIKKFKESLKTQLFPHRTEVPKTLIFAKTDSHADDIINIVREEFGEGNEFCQKVTYSADDPEGALNSFRNDYYPRIAVTVNMIATGTDVKSIECLLFMRDVRSKGYFEQMKGRGTRTLSKEELQQVTPSATQNKDHFVIVDAVGVTKSQKSDTRPLERKPSVSLKQLMMEVATGAKDEDTLTTLANRLVRLNAQATEKEKALFKVKVGLDASTVAEQLLDCFDEDIIEEKARQDFKCAEPTEEQILQTRKTMAKKATEPFYKAEIRDFIENLRKSHEQIIDDINIDTLQFAGFDKDQKQNAQKVIESFHKFIDDNIDEITALGIIYEQRYKDRPIVLEQLKALYEKLKMQNISVDRLWDCYGITQQGKVKMSAIRQITDLVAMIRFEMGRIDALWSFQDLVDKKFKDWTFKRNHAEKTKKLTDEQLEWLRLIKDHIASSLSIQPEDLELSPFDSMGGLGKYYQVFGDEYEEILKDLNRVLVA
ncbi:MAG: type I restriction-modification enzyme R subunit C-terminal domain-containing protein [Treponema sp.]|uniref:type I restriction endonuclease subunit R n=1 Tax=Treponema sp. TaxID=166 RepID=UPI002A90F710|nr:DEAD/DEAH box helicase family protein [Treponema sp.]MDY6397999.1 type I restriction-modification enzyme R subunit C-terminal domain-containing protein [Treponema sp.]